MNVLRNRAPGGKYKIAVVVAKYGLVGGGERFAGEVTERLARDSDLEVHVFANRWVSLSNRITFHKVPMVRFPRALRPLSFAWFAHRLISDAGFDLVHSHERTFEADVFSVHFVPHGGWVRDVRGKRPGLFDRSVIAVERRMLRKNPMSWFLPVSSLAEATFHGEYPSLPGHWRVLPPGVDAARFAAPDRAACRAEIREHHGIHEAELLVFFAGMNFELKGLDLLIAAVARARVERPEAGIRLLVAGRGNERKYRKLARSYGIEDAVTFAGTLTNGIERYYRASDLFAMPSKFDTFGMVVLEAMAAGLPVLVTETVGARDLVQEGRNGFVQPAKTDPVAVAQRIIQLLDPERREAMGAAALQTAAEHDWDRLVSRIRGIYSWKLHRKPAAG